MQVTIPDVPSYWTSIGDLPGAEKLTLIEVAMLEAMLVAFIDTALKDCWEQIDEAMRGMPQKILKDQLTKNRSE